MPKETTKEEFLDAVYRGVYDAMWQMITSGTDMPCADFYEMIKKGTKEAMKNNLKTEN